MVVTPATDGAALRGRVERAIERQVARLQSLQHPVSGHWEAELEANDTITAEWILLMRLLGCPDARREQAAARWIRGRQSEDGAWRLYPGAPGDLSTTAECYFALKLVGDAPEAPHMARAAGFVRAAGGVERVRAFTRIHLALAGACDFAHVPVLPTWLLLIPPRAPFSIYDMSSWARSCVVPLTLLLDAQPVVPLGRVDELAAGVGWAYPRTNAFTLADRVLHRVRISPRIARERALAWILEHFETSGDFGGIFPAMMYALLALRSCGYRIDDPLVTRALAALDRFGREDSAGFRMQSCVSPVWDTALCATALAEAGLPADDPALARAAAWLLGKEVTRPGDWAARTRPGVRPGGWSFEHDNTLYPDVDDTCVVALLMSRLGRGQKAVARAVDWVLAMQSRDGGWAAFDVDNTRALWNAIPFADHGAMLDPPTADITGRALELLGAVGFDARHPVVRRALRFLSRAQERDGSWPGRWGVHYLYGTSVVVRGLRAVGVPEHDGRLARAVAFFVRTQHPDGGWGESPKSYESGRFVAAPATASQTAWALSALSAAGLAGHPVARRGAAWLCAHQKPAGGWDEAAFTGTGFPGHFYIRYHFYREHYPLAALARWRRALDQENYSFSMPGNGNAAPASSG